ncbi:restriction endonuclease subunit S [bacterium]|nr:restriction endonuclease subunit S [bacterium]
MKSGWKTVTLKEISKNIQYGYTAGASGELIGPKFLRITDIVPALISWNSVPYCEIAEKDLGKYLLHDGDIVIARTGATTGYAKYIKGNPDSVFASYLVRVQLKPDVDRLFIGKIVESDIYKKYIHQNIGGSAQPNANAKILTSFPIDLPPLSTQHKIARILSSYDELIENNTRRIQILEEMALRIYCEWFIHFRSPGRKSNNIVESELGIIPDGWEFKTLSEVASVIDCLHSKKPKQCKTGSGILLHVWNVSDNGQLDLSKIFNISEEDYKLWTKRIELKAGDCIITKTGRVGAVAQIPSNFRAAIGRNLVVIRWPKAPVYLFQYLLSPHKEREIQRLRSSGTIMESIHVAAIEKFIIRIPPYELLERFENAVGQIQKLIDNLTKKNRCLYQTRDLLLPKLISGKIDVSELDIDIREGR